jgi:hypothetical protein
LLFDSAGGASMSQEDIARYQRRAAEERALASSAGDARVAQSHSDLADKYASVATAYLTLTRPR